MLTFLLFEQEKLFRQEKDMHIQQLNVIDDKDLYIEMRTGLLDNIIASGSCDMTSFKKSQMNKRNFKKTLIYDSDDELSDSKSVSDHSIQWNEAITKENNSSGNGSSEAKINKIQDINLSDHEKCEESIQNNEDKKDNEDHFHEKDCEKKIHSPISQKISPNTHNVNVSNANIIVSSASSPFASQNSRAVTPENHVNIMEELFTESIKKSHKKVKQVNRKSFISKSLHQKMKLAHSDENITVHNATCPLNSQDSVRPKTPDNINSSRLLLMQFNSVKKSHKKDKHNKRISGLAKCHKYQEYRKRNGNSILNNKSKEDINESLHRDSFESLELKNSPDASPKKKKKSMNVSIKNETHRWLSESPLSHENTKDEFKIYTPIKRISDLFAAPDNVCINESSSDKSESVQVMPTKVDFSECLTPTIHCSRKSRKSEHVHEYIHADKSKTDACISHDEIANTADPKDCIEISHNGRTTPTNMSTTELLCDINSIKKSHKKNKYSSSICKRGRKGSSHNPEMSISKSVNFANDISEATFEEHATSVLQHSDTCNLSIKTEMCSNIHDVKEDENYEGTIYDTPQPSTSRSNDIGNVLNINASNLLNATPPNDFNTTNFITLFNSTSIKKFHKKERDYNAETKYILMSSEHDLSDDGSIFDKEDRLNISGDVNPCQDSENEMCT